MNPHDEALREFGDYVDLPPVHIDIERMERALAGPRFTLPSGLSAEEIVQYINDCATGKIAPNVREG